ncbi:MAG: RNA polymerase sigma factor [Bacillota bacterium]|nr:RNA polymerase sigma factor [Bacillota bacterium]
MLPFYLSLLIDEPEKIKFEQLYLQYRHTMFWVAHEILEDQELAEDAVHDAFLRVLDHIQNISLKKCNKTRSFIVIIVRNIALDMVRKRNKLAEVDIDDQLNIPAGNLSDPETLMLNKESIERIMKALKNLKQSYTDILTLHFVHEYSNQEIAQMLNLSPENVRIRLYRGRKRLLSLLKEDDELGSKKSR